MHPRRNNAIDETVENYSEWVYALQMPLPPTPAELVAYKVINIVLMSKNCTKRSWKNENLVMENPGKVLELLSVHPTWGDPD